MNNSENLSNILSDINNIDNFELSKFPVEHLIIDNFFSDNYLNKALLYS